MYRVSVVGLGKLGQCLAATLALRGFDTLGVDIDSRIVQSINNGQATVIEPGLQEIITRVGRKLKATQSHAEAILETDITCILVATPSEPEGNFSNRHLEAAFHSLAESLGKSSKRYHLFMIHSTVMPGAIEGYLIPLIEKVSGKRLNQDFGVCYCPELVALGNVIQDFLRPDLVMIGQSDDFAGDQAIRIYNQLTENSPPIFRMSIPNAEIAKISLNCYITLKIGFANTLANLCECIPGGDVDTVTQVLGADRRISPYYLRGGLAYGGTCFPRDTSAFVALARRYGYEAELVQAAERINHLQNEHLCRLVYGALAGIGGREVSILGLAFKPNTPVITESPAIKLIEMLLKSRVEIYVFDPQAMEETKRIFGNQIHYCQSAEQCLGHSPVCVLVTPWKEFQSIEALDSSPNPLIFIDCWRFFNPSKLSSRTLYVPWGRHQSHRYGEAGPAKIIRFKGPTRPRIQALPHSSKAITRHRSDGAKLKTEKRS